MNSDPKSPAKPTPATTETVDQKGKAEKAPEYGGRKGPEPTRYGDWENGGKCVDF